MQIDRPTPLVVGDCQVTEIIQPRMGQVNMTVIVPHSIVVEDNAKLIHDHIRKSTIKAFDYLIAEGFVKDRNFIVIHAIIGEPH